MSSEKHRSRVGISSSGQQAKGGPHHRGAHDLAERADMRQARRGRSRSRTAPRACPISRAAAPACAPPRTARRAHPGRRRTGTGSSGGRAVEDMAGLPESLRGASGAGPEGPEVMHQPRAHVNAAGRRHLHGAAPAPSYGPLHGGMRHGSDAAGSARLHHGGLGGRRPDPQRRRNRTHRRAGGAAAGLCRFRPDPACRCWPRRRST